MEEDHPNCRCSLGELTIHFDIDASPLLSSLREATSLLGVLSLSLGDKAWLQECQIRERKIAEIFGLPPYLIGGTSCRTAMQEAWEDTEPTASALKMIELLKSAYMAPALTILQRTYNQIGYRRRFACSEPPRKLRKCVLRRQAKRRKRS